MTIIPTWRHAWRMASMQVAALEATVEWPKGVTAGDLFELAAQV